VDHDPELAEVEAEELAPALAAPAGTAQEGVNWRIEGLKSCERGELAALDLSAGDPSGQEGG
jgi:hypothetical protein